MRRIPLCAFLVCLLQAVPAAPSLAASAPAGRALDVLDYTARLDPDVAAKTLTGRVTIGLRMLVSGHEAIELDRGDLDIDAVSEGGRSLAYSKAGSRLIVRLPRPSRQGERHRIAIDYHGAPTYGLEFHPERAQVYTIFSTSQWMPALDTPDERATLDLSVALPAGWSMAGNGRRVSRRALDDGRVLERWRTARSVPSYTFGFATGAFTEVEQRGSPNLRYLASEHSADEMRRIFVDTGDMLDFFSRKAGVSYGDATYTQGLVADTIGQELDGLALLSDSYGREVLADPSAKSLIAHEAAHQWWGNRVTCVDWTHFWLNEGFATFMAAAYLQHRFGETAYRNQVDRWHTRVERLRREGKDKPLVFPVWSKPSSDDRAVVYQKGAYVLHLLREQLGERAFWKGIRAYTRHHIDQSVITTDFQRSMERSSGRDLSAFFAEWVYPLRRAGE